MDNEQWIMDNEKWLLRKIINYFFLAIILQIVNLWNR